MKRRLSGSTLSFSQSKIAANVTCEGALARWYQTGYDMTDKEAKDFFGTGTGGGGGSSSSFCGTSSSFGFCGIGRRTGTQKLGRYKKGSKW